MYFSSHPDALVEVQNSVEGDRSDSRVKCISRSNSLFSNNSVAGLDSNGLSQFWGIPIHSHKVSGFNTSVLLSKPNSFNRASCLVFPGGRPFPVQLKALGDGNQKQPFSNKGSANVTASNSEFFDVISVYIDSAMNED